MFKLFLKKLLILKKKCMDYLYIYIVVSFKFDILIIYKINYDVLFW